MELLDRTRGGHFRNDAGHPAHQTISPKAVAVPIPSHSTKTATVLQGVAAAVTLHFRRRGMLSGIEVRQIFGCYGAEVISVHFNKRLS
mmetsp:Transcript_25235/g.70363  ORF Transcript_25235/g.70363 Transcript_25235/m.70363 type:complete len:88 (+) Transcript_25235:47-310(+)